jgi:excisionase family DNA binding protein
LIHETVEDLLSSAEAADLLGVSPASVKRWADEGLLACARTGGGHRRFSRSAVEDFRARQAGLPVSPPPRRGQVNDWIDALRRFGRTQEIEGLLLTARAELGTWWRVAELLGAVLVEVGDRWASGKLSIIEEHLVSERLARALARLAEWMPLTPASPVALLATAEGDEHTLGLSLVELCLREQGWETLWAGRRTPASALASMAGAVDLVAVSASCASDDARNLALEIAPVVDACRRRGVPLLLGGHGNWPQLDDTILLRELRLLPDTLDRLRR